MSTVPSPDCGAVLADRYNDAITRAIRRSMSPDYQGCSVHLNAIIALGNHVPYITRYELSDWCDGSTVGTWVDGEKL